MRPLAALLSLATLPSIAAAQAADTTRFKVPGGIEKVWTTTDGAKHFYYESNSRGRGPVLTERVVLGTDGYPDTIEISGHTNLKAPVDERFTMQRAGTHWKAAWTNPAESASVSLSRRAFYVAMNDASNGALLAPLLLKGGHAPVPLLPEGQAWVERLRDTTVSSGGKTKKLTLYATHILGLAPQTWWADESNEFFAGGLPMVIREGFEELLPELRKIQSAYDSARGADVAKRLIRTPSRAVAFRNANLFDAESGQMRPRTTVVVSGNRISAVGADGRVAIPAGAEVIDVEGKTLMPGLWDMHVHLFTDDPGLLHMAAGVTSVREMSSDVDETPRRTKRFDDGSLIGPRVMGAGFIDSPGPYSSASTKALVATADSAKALVERYAGLGFQQIKVNGSLDTALVPVIVAEAHKRGLRVSGHVPQGLTAAEFVRAGADELQHVYFLFLNFWRDSVDTRTTQRFTVPAQRAALLDLRSEGVQSFIKLLHERGTVIDPTLVQFEGTLVLRARMLDPGSAEIADRFPVLRRRSLFTRGLEVVDSLDQRYRDSFAACIRLVKAMYDGGVTIVAGTDQQPFSGFALHRELELYAAAGIPAPEVLRIATINAAKVMKRDKELGSIAPGKLADLIVVDGHPEQRMSDIRRVTMVMKDGKFYDPAALYSAIGVKPAVVSR